MYIPTANSYYSGGGLMDYGLSQAGVNIIQSVEVDSKCVQTLKKNFNHTIVHADMRDVTAFDQPDADMMIGTYPCNKYSELADIHGTRTGEDLYLHYFRQVALRLPEMYVAENVPGMKKFPVVMEAMTKLPGYYIQVFCPVNALNWLPQKRKRLIIFGTKKRLTISPPKAYKRLTLADIIEEIPDMEIPEGVLNRLNGHYRDYPILSDPSDKDSVAPACLAHYAKDRSTRLVVDRSHPLGKRPYSVREFARLQGVPDSFSFCGSDNDAYRMIGNGVPVPLAEWIGKEAIKYFN